MRISEEMIDIEKQKIIDERKTYKFPNLGTKKFFEYVATGFFFFGFATLLLAFFTDLTLIHATCFFVISHVIQPTDGDRYETIVKGIAEDLANIRLNTTFLKHLEKK
ncbi:MAG: hypothetical protein DI626_08815 [Micavibrio aeruginosavorus]|uniref:Uncharacterized protein n=1 Tax=Micavibrio aeruginosavorus TaxID=349221 RepID=A0A2W4ZU01_9BACT|nr:MAG: hypothetical protein DI626_08815 [Micavibrio aeruginosavorus]